MHVELSGDMLYHGAMLFAYEKCMIIVVMTPDFAVCVICPVVDEKCGVTDIYMLP